MLRRFSIGGLGVFLKIQRLKRASFPIMGARQTDRRRYAILQRFKMLALAFISGRPAARLVR